jgi:hypothetical protein
MATATAPPVTEETGDRPYLITSDQFEQMIEAGVFPCESGVYLWDGRLYEKMSKTLWHAAVHNAFLMALVPRLPPGFFVGTENPVRLDPLHLPLPDLIVARGAPLDFGTRYPDRRDVVLVVEVAVSSLPQDLGVRLSRYALTLPDATYLVADVRHKQVLVHTDPRPADEAGRGSYGACTVVKPGESIRLRLGGVEIAPIPFEEVLR